VALVADGAALTDRLTLLRAHNGRRLTKTFRLATNGRVSASPYDNAKFFTAEAVPVEGIHHFQRLLRGIEGDPHACVIRGEPAAGADLSRLRRMKAENGGAFAEVPRRWAMLDLDGGIPLPPGCSVLADPTEAARAVLDILAAHAPELEGVSAVVQFSSSAGLDEMAAGEAVAEETGIQRDWSGVAKPGLRAHVWFWLREPLGEAELKRWRERVQAAGLPLDAATLQTVQPHYTAAPVFDPPLRDPLAGRRTVLVQGAEDTAELEIPAHGTTAATRTGDSAQAGRGYLGHLDAIGPEGFHAPILRAVSAFVAINWPDPDLDALRADLRARILSADPGGRTAAEIVDRASDRHLNSIIAWALGRERSKREARVAEAAAAMAAAPAVEPTYPDRGVPLDEAQDQAKAAMGRFAERVALGERPELLLRKTVGGGKSDLAIKSADLLHTAAHDGEQGGAIHFLLPRHDLGAELLARVRAEKPGMRAALAKGIEWKNPDDPNDVMCLDPELPRAAMAASQPAPFVCVACRFDGQCPYTLQQEEAKDADVVLMAHNHAFQHKPSWVPNPGVVVFDEAFWPSGIKGNNPLEPVQLAVSSLRDERTGAVTGWDRERLLWLRRRAADALEGHGKGGLLREALVAAGLTEENAGEWLSLEWQTKPEVKITDGMARGEVLDTLNRAAAQGFTRLRPLLAEHARDLLAGDDARCVNATVIPDAPLGGDQGTGPVVRFAWREDFAEWVANAPKLILDATTHAEVVKAWVPGVEVVDIEIQAPGQHVRQIIGREFGRTFFAQCASNVERLADFLMVELARSTGEVVVIVQLAIETPLRDAIRRRLEGALPNRLHIAHHGAITGLDAFRDAERVVVVGRPATDRIAGERLGELAKGGPVDTVADAEDTRWPTLTQLGHRFRKSRFRSSSYADVPGP
jgi:hypothetical protein